MDHAEHSHHASRPAWRSKWTLIAFLAVAGFFLWTEHRAHVLGVLPYLLALACPLMHLFHHGHGHHHGSRDAAGPDERATPEVRHEP
jgi:hypothetical protein